MAKQRLPVQLVSNKILRVSHPAVTKVSADNRVMKKI